LIRLFIDLSLISDTEMYSTVYTNQMFQPDVFQADDKPMSENGY